MKYIRYGLSVLLVLFDAYLAWRVLSPALILTVGNPNLPLVTAVYLEATMYFLATLVVLLTLSIIVQLLK